MPALLLTQTILPFTELSRLNKQNFFKIAIEQRGSIVYQGCARNALRTRFYMLLHVLTCFYMFLHVFYMSWAKKWSPDFWDIFKNVVELYTFSRLDFEERQRREVRALGLLFICSGS